MICANLDVGVLPSIDLAPAKVTKWQEDKIRGFAEAMDGARQRGAVACVMAGGLFATDFVAQSLLEATAKAIDGGLPVYYVPREGEADGIRGRMPMPKNLTVVSPSTDGRTAVRIEEADLALTVLDGSGLEDVSEVARPSDALSIIRSGSDVGISLNCGSSFVSLGPLGPSAFGGKTSAGYLLADLSSGNAAYERVKTAPHPFVVKEVVLDKPESPRKLVTTVGEAVKDVGRESCLRVELRGRAPLDVPINTEDLADQLGRYFFYVEVADECELDINIAELESDVSLLAEFVRLVTGDDSLSGTEKARVLRCGWNVLNGKELAE